MTKYLVVVVDTYYPSVLHFNSYEEAKIRFRELHDEGCTVHLSEIKDTFHRDKYEDEDVIYEVDKYEKEPSILDVRW